MDYIDNRYEKSSNGSSNDSLLYIGIFLAGVVVAYLFLRPQIQPIQPAQFAQPIQPAQSVQSIMPARYDNDERYHVIRGQDGFIVDLEVKREAEVK